jgi:peptidoglycan/LPS O-acetylase OafA/YrhL
MRMTSTSPHRIPELDGLRALAILLVFAGHALGIRMMWIGVDLFFVLSGFLITGILLDEPKLSLRRYLASFYARRARRILPGFLLCLLVVSLPFGFSWLHRWWLAFGLMNFMEAFWRDHPYPALAPLWSLALEEQFYLFWPLVLFVIAPRKLPRLFVALLILAPLLRGLCTPWLAHQQFNRFHWAVYKIMPFRMDTLVAGALLTLLWRSHREKIRSFGFLGLIAALLMPPLMLVLGRYDRGFSTVADTVRGNVLTYEVSLLAVTGLMLWGLGGRYTALLRLAPMRWLARISYSFYLIHEAALELAAKYLHHPAYIVGASAADSLVYATLSWHLLERPVLARGNRRIASRELRAASHT